MVGPARGNSIRSGRRASGRCRRPRLRRQRPRRHARPPRTVRRRRDPVPVEEVSPGARLRSGVGCPPQDAAPSQSEAVGTAAWHDLWHDPVRPARSRSAHRADGCAISAGRASGARARCPRNALCRIVLSVDQVCRLTVVREAGRVERVRCGALRIFVVARSVARNMVNEAVPLVQVIQGTCGS